MWAAMRKETNTLRICQNNLVRRALIRATYHGKCTTTACLYSSMLFNYMSNGRLEALMMLLERKFCMQSLVFDTPVCSYFHRV
jgi:hypothetical protein